MVLKISTVEKWFDLDANLEPRLLQCQLWLSQNLANESVICDLSACLSQEKQRKPLRDQKEIGSIQRSIN